VQQFAGAGGLVLGICNGFQILLEAGLLPGAMVRNARLRFICRQVHIRVENSSTPFTLSGEVGQVLKIPVAHMGGNYVCDDATLDELQCEDRIIFRYTTPRVKLMTPRIPTVRSRESLEFVIASAT
jgi:phosphoribosylformylglycinamidine synthase